MNISWLSIVHNENSYPFVLPKGKNELIFSKIPNNPTLHFGDSSRTDIRGRIDHEKKEISILPLDKFRKVPLEYTISLLKMDYPDYKIYLFDYYGRFEKVINEQYLPFEDAEFLVEIKTIDVFETMSKIENILRKGYRSILYKLNLKQPKKPLSYKEVATILRAATERELQQKEELKKLAKIKKISPEIEKELNQFVNDITNDLGIKYEYSPKQFKYNLQSNLSRIKSILQTKRGLLTDKFLAIYLILIQSPISLES